MLAIKRLAGAILGGKFEKSIAIRRLVPPVALKPNVRATKSAKELPGTSENGTTETNT